MRRSLLVLVPNPTDATSWYRSIPALSRLRKTMDLSLVFVQENNWSTMKLVDGVFIQRPFLSTHRQLIEMAKDAGKRVWVDYDDDLFSVPTDNPTHCIYGSRETQTTVATITAMADVVTVSTNHLKSNLSMLNKDIRVIPNAFDTDLMVLPMTRHPERRLIMWRGSNTHHRDIMSVSDQIVDFTKAHPEWMWNFIGSNNWFLTDRMPHETTTVTEGLDIMKYFRYIRRMAPDLVVAPLFPNEFNRSKSNIAWMEAAYAGAACLCPEWEEWVNPGALTYKDPDGFLTMMNHVANGDINLAEQAMRSWEYILDTLTLDRVNPLRQKIVEEITA